MAHAPGKWIFFVRQGDSRSRLGRSAQEVNAFGALLPGGLRLQMTRATTRFPGRRAIMLGGDRRVSYRSGQIVERSLVESDVSAHHFAAFIQKKNSGDRLRVIPAGNCQPTVD